MNGKAMPLFTAWLRWPHHRKFESVVFRPAQLEVPGYYNLFKGWPLKPEPKADWSFLRDHLFNHIAAGNKDHFMYIMRWFADLVQNPEGARWVALVLRSAEGAGKSILSDVVMRQVLGSSLVLSVGPDAVLSQFNSDFAHKLLISAEEAFFAADPRNTGRLKNMISNPTMRLEFKGIDPTHVPNFARLLMLTNEDYAVPVSAGDRRYAVFDVHDSGQTRLKNQGGWKDDFKTQIGSLLKPGTGVLERFFHELLTFDCASIDLDDIPDTQARREQKDAAMDTLDVFFRDLLEEGALPEDQDGKGKTPCQDLLDAYEKSCGRHERVKRSDALHTRGRKIFGDILFTKTTPTTVPGLSSKQRCFQFGPLPDCRAAWERYRRESCWTADERGQQWAKTAN